MGCLFSKIGRNSARGYPKLGNAVSGVQNVNLYSYEELAIATDNFSPRNRIDEGGFGSLSKKLAIPTNDCREGGYGLVYKGILRDGQVVAIKVLSADSTEGVKKFLTEIEVISDIEHKYLVKLYGCCVERNQRILVYSYLEMDSLATTLVGGGSIHFTWETRVKLCTGVAKGLAYLHLEVRPYIVHGDIKASNILLDKDLTPKISNFGLTKLMPPNTTRGAKGYLAPEYAISGQLTSCADVFSFGVLLIEIVSGRRNTNTRLPVAEQYILEKAWNLYKRNKLVTLVDTALDGFFDVEQACKFFKIGLLCTQDSPELRPSMMSVVSMLTGAKIDEDEIRKPGGVGL